MLTSDPLAEAAGPLALAELADREWVLFPSHHGLSDVIATACGRAGFQPRETVRTSQVEAAARLAAAGLGVALVPDNGVAPGLEAGVRPLEPPLVRELVAFTRSEWSPLARAYLDVLHAVPWRRRPAAAAVVA